MPDVPAPVGGFALSDFTNIPNPPPDDTLKTTPDAGTAAPGQAASVPVAEPPISDLTPDEPQSDKPEPAEEPVGGLETVMRQSPADMAKKDAETEKARLESEAAAAAKAKPDATSTPDRDKDLVYEPAPHQQPKTRKLIEGFQAKARDARNERDAAAAQAKADRDAWQKEKAELEQKLKGTTLPKEVETEIATLRERVRELDIAQDPAIDTKYNKPIAANNEAIVAVLRSQGYGSKPDAEGKLVENPQAIASLIKAGLTYDNLQPLIDKLKTAGLHGEARKIERAIDKNESLAEERTKEIDTWKKDHGLRTQQREQMTKQQAEAQNAAYGRQTQAQLQADLDALAKDFSYLKPPAEPALTDTPEVKKAKEAAMAEYRASEAKIHELVKGLNPTGASPEKTAEIIGRINANAIQAITLKEVVLPRVLKEIAALKAQLKERDDELGKIRDAGKLSRLQGGGPDVVSGGEQAQSLEAAFQAAMPR